MSHYLLILPTMGEMKMLQNHSRKTEGQFDMWKLLNGAMPVCFITLLILMLLQREILHTDILTIFLC